MSTVDVQVTLKLRGRAKLPVEAAAPRVPRITRLMALAIKFQGMVDRGEVRDYADLARLGYVTRARLTQILNLSLRAPGLQEEIRFASDGVGIPERLLRQIVIVIDWGEQRRCWTRVRTAKRKPSPA